MGIASQGTATRSFLLIELADCESRFAKSLSGVARDTARSSFDQ